MAVKNINFLLKQDAPINEIAVNGTVFADLDGNGQFDGDDTPAGGVTVYFDANRNGVHDSGEQTVLSTDDPATRGQYAMTIPAALKSTYAVGIIAPTADWIFTNPADGVQDLFAGPGDAVNNLDFYIQPPNDAFPPSGSNQPGNIIGVVYNDQNNNGVRNAGEPGLAGFRVFIDANENGNFDMGEADSITSSNGTLLLSRCGSRFDPHQHGRGRRPGKCSLPQPASEKFSWARAAPSRACSLVSRILLAAIGAICPTPITR